MSEILLFCGGDFTLGGNDVTILVSYDSFSVGFNFTHYQIPKDLSYLHLYERLIGIFREVIIWEELLFCKMDHKIFKCCLRKLTRDRLGLQVSPFLVRKCVS